MRISGAAILARKHVVTKQFGEEAWVGFFRDITARFPYFARPVVATSIVPLPEFISFQDELVRRFFDGESASYFVLGERCARWAVTEGPHRSFIADRDFQDFVEFFPRTWPAYFLETSSYCTTKLAGSAIDFEVFDLPLWHPYFEYFVVGYFKGALDLMCANPVHTTQVHGGSGTHYRYRLWTGLPGSPPERDGSCPTSNARLATSDIEKVVAFVEEHLGMDIDLAHLAQIVDYCPDHLARLFKRAFGVPLYQYVLMRRMERAKALLSDRGHSIAAVARACGFARPSHFSAAFKARVGITPGAYRRDARSEEA